MPRNYKKKHPDKQLGRPTEWTEDRALELGEGLIAWMEASSDNVYWEKYLYLERKEEKLYPELISYLTSKYDSFLQLVKRAKKIQEIRLLEKEGKGEIKSLFVLKNHHGYADRTEVKTENVNYNYDPKDLREKTQDDLQEMLMNLTRKPSKTQSD